MRTKDPTTKRMPWDEQATTGLERAYCDSCQSTFTLAKGRCTGCIMREENRKQGVVYLGFGVAIVFLGGASSSILGFGVIGLITSFIGLGFALRGLRAMLMGRNAEV